MTIEKHEQKWIDDFEINPMPTRRAFITKYGTETFERFMAFQLNMPKKVALLFAIRLWESIESLKTFVWGKDCSCTLEYEERGNEFLSSLDALVELMPSCGQCNPEGR
jgi:hypothetical protein